MKGFYSMQSDLPQAVSRRSTLCRYALYLLATAVGVTPSSVLAQKRWDPNATHPPLVLPCSDSLCLTLQTVFDAAVIDFRQYRPETSKDDPIRPVPDLSLDILKVNCKMSLWANNVPSYGCAAQQPLAGADIWFRNVLQTAKTLKPRWEAAMQTRGSDTVADLGPPGCGPTADDGPYLGQCPLHIELSKQADGTAIVRLWMNSLTSAYLVPSQLLPNEQRSLSARNSGGGSH
jgi:hypothetical protein